MPRGKKYDAAEKHFSGELARLLKKIKSQQENIFLLEVKTRELEQRLAQFQAKNDALTAENKMLRKMAPLSDADVRVMVENAKVLNSVTSLLGRSYALEATGE